MLQNAIYSTVYCLPVVYNQSTVVHQEVKIHAKRKGNGSTFVGLSQHFTVHSHFGCTLASKISFSDEICTTWFTVVNCTSLDLSVVMQAIQKYVFPCKDVELYSTLQILISLTSSLNFKR